jgi:hypothetical protein
MDSDAGNIPEIPQQAPSERADTATKPQMPDWALEVFKEFIDHGRKLGQVLRLSVMGIHMVRAGPDALKALAEGQRVLGEIDGNLAEQAERLKEAERDRELAQHEVDHGFPLLYEQATVALWSSLEALIRTFVAKWLENSPDAWRCDEICRLRVRLGDYEALGRSDRCLWIVDLLDQETGGPLRNGVNRFECLLQPFGLGGKLDDKTQKVLFEFVASAARPRTPTRICGQAPPRCLSLAKSHLRFEDEDHA